MRLGSDSAWWPASAEQQAALEQPPPGLPTSLPCTAPRADCLSDLAATKSDRTFQRNEQPGSSRSPEPRAAELQVEDSRMHTSIWKSLSDRFNLAKSKRNASGARPSKVADLSVTKVAAVSADTEAGGS